MIEDLLPIGLLIVVAKLLKCLLRVCAAENLPYYI